MALTRPRAAQIYDIDYKQATRVVTVSNITLSGGAPNQVDGVNLSLKDRVLVTGQSTASQNGIYYVTTLGSGSNGTWSRSLDTDSTGEILTGTIVMVTEGTIYADTQWKLITDGTITVGVTAQEWVQNYMANSISSGTSNVVVTSNANVTISSAGSANVLLVSSTGLVVAGNISPSANITYDLGTNTSRWKDIWLSNSSIYLGNVTLSANATALNVNGVPVVTSDGGIITATGNITAGNLNTGGMVSATGNIDGNYLNANIYYATGFSASRIYLGNSEVNVVAAGGNVNVSVGGTSNVAVFATTGEYVTGVVSASGNVTGGNLNTGGMVSATGNVDANYLNANIYYATGFSASKIFSGNSEVNVTSSGGNVNVSVGGTSNVAVYATTGEYVTGVVSASGNVTGGNLNTGGLVSSTGNVQAGNLRTGGEVSASGNVTGSYLLGNAASVTGVNAFSSIAVSGANTIQANSISTELTIAAGNNIVLTTSNVTNTLTIAYTGSSSSSIFATGGDMGLVTEAVSSSEDLGLVIDAPSISYDLGQLGVTGVVSGSDIIANTITMNNLATNIAISTTGNIAFANASIGSSTNDVRGWSYNSSYSFADKEQNATGIALNNAGTKMYFVGTYNKTVYQFTLSTAYQLNTATYDYLTANVASQDTSPQDLRFNSAGSTLWVLGGANATIFQYTTSSGNVATATYGNINLSVSAQEPTPTGFTLSPDGSNAYVVGSTNKTIYQYTVSSAGNIATGGYSTKSFSVANQDTAPSAIQLNADGTILWVLGSANNSVYQYTLINAFDVSTATYTGKFFVGDQETSPYGLYVDIAGGGAYMLGPDSDTAYQYNTGNSTIVTSNSFFQTSTSVQVAGNLFAGGNITAGNVRTGNSFVAVGNVRGANILTTGIVSATGNITGNYFIGNGSALTGITSTPPPLNINLQQNYGGF